jgi:hypothetical protein
MIEVIAYGAVGGLIFEGCRRLVTTLKKNKKDINSSPTADSLLPFPFEWHPVVRVKVSEEKWQEGSQIMRYTIASTGEQSEREVNFPNFKSFHLEYLDNILFLFVRDPSPLEIMERFE